MSPYLALDKILTLLQWKKEDLGELVLSLPNWWAPLRSCAGGLASRAFLFSYHPNADRNRPSLGGVIELAVLLKKWAMRRFA